MQEKKDEMVLCLCRRCLQGFFATGRYHIERVDPYEVIKEACTVCQVGRGYDFRIITRTKRLETEEQP